MKQDILFLDQDHILVVEKLNGMPCLIVYSIKNVQQPVPRCRFQLPATWKNSILSFHENDAPRMDPPKSSAALFYSDPARRLLVLSVRPSPRAKVVNWMIFLERLFISSQFRGVNMEWNDWRQFVLIRNTSGTQILGRPSVVGSRILYLDQDSSGTKARINAINFAPHCDSALTSQAMWDFAGERSLLVPTESKREISSVNERDGSKLLDLRATEDNIVLLYVRV